MEERRYYKVWKEDADTNNRKVMSIFASKERAIAYIPEEANQFSCDIWVTPEADWWIEEIVSGDE